MAELDSEERWSTAFASSQNELAALAEEALREFAAGETLPLDLERDLSHHATLSKPLRSASTPTNP
jgi:hypothetical protein